MTNTTNNDSGLNLDHLEAVPRFGFCDIDSDDFIERPDGEYVKLTDVADALARRAAPAGLSTALAEATEKLGRVSAESLSLNMSNIDLRDQLARRAAPVSAPIAVKTWQERAEFMFGDEWQKVGSLEAYKDAEIADLRAALGTRAAPIAGDALAKLTKERDGWKEEAEHQQALYERACRQIGLLHEHERDRVWIWQGDGTDNLSSMSNGMAVLIRADDLRAALANQPAPTGTQAYLAAELDPAEPVYRVSDLAHQPAPTAAPEQVAAETMLRDMLAIQEACNLHTDEYAPGSVIEYIKELEDDSQPSEAAPLAEPFGMYVEREDGSTEFQRTGKAFQPTGVGYKVWTLYAAAPSLPAAHRAKSRAQAGEYCEHPAFLKIMEDILTPQGVAKFNADEDVNLNREFAGEIFKAGIAAHQPAQEQAIGCGGSGKSGAGDMPCLGCDHCQAQEQAEPVAWMIKTGHGTRWTESRPGKEVCQYWTPLFASPVVRAQNEESEAPLRRFHWSKRGMEQDQHGFYIAYSDQRAQAVEIKARKLSALFNQVQRACSKLPEGYEVLIELERGAGGVVWIDTEGKRHVIEGEGYLSDDVYEAVDAAIRAAQEGGAA